MSHSDRNDAPEPAPSSLLAILKIFASVADMRLDRLINDSLRLGNRRTRLLLAAGRASVNGRVTVDRDRMVGKFDRVEVDGSAVQARTPLYIALHKPVGIVSATSDAHHTTAIDLIREPWAPDLHIAGRLDRFASGLLVLTNDGRFSESLTLPQRGVGKTYLVGTDQPISNDAVAAFRRGMPMAKEGIITQPARVELLQACLCRLTIFEGKHHQVKRMFARFHIRVTSLHREAIGGIGIHALAPGQYRQLGNEEISFLANGKQSFYNTPPLPANDPA